MYEWYCICIEIERPDGPPNGVFGPFHEIEGAVQNSKSQCDPKFAKHVIGKGPLPPSAVGWISIAVPDATSIFYMKYPKHRPWYLNEDMYIDWDEVRRRGGRKDGENWLTPRNERHFEEDKEISL